MDKILIVDDDITFALMLKTWLTKKGFEVESVGNTEAGRQRLTASRFSLVLTDMRLPDQDGIYLLQWMAENCPPTPAIVMTSYADIHNAVLSMKLGAKDYVSKPVNPDELLKKINEALSSQPKAEQTKAPEHTAKPSVRQTDYIEGRSDASRRLYEYVKLVAPTNMSVLINGASGTGKEHIAHLIHQNSRRSSKPFVAVDCGAIPRDLAASEFFGHIKGSFTGAISDKIGAFTAAAGGTLFLDEVGNLSYDIQVQLLRALQERRIKPIGSNKEIPTDIRLIAATNENLEMAIERGTFRTDLYHRINEFTINTPQLCEQREDIMLYADFFLDQANGELGKSIIGFEADAAAAMMGYSWPGNMRQMKNTVMCATLLAQGEYITIKELPSEVAQPSQMGHTMALRNPLDEEGQIRRAMAAAGNNKSQAAKLLGIDRKTLYNKLRLYGME